MSQKELILFLGIFLLWTTCTSVLAFQSWKMPEQLRNKAQSLISRLPDWFPLKGSVNRTIASSYWILQIRLISTIGSLVGVLLLALGIYIGLFR